LCSAFQMARDLFRADDLGRQLSTGEWQRVVLAKAQLRNGLLLVMDEPTSSLAPLAETRILEEYRRLTAGKTTILASHRLAMARSADLIVVIDKGRVIETGSHEDLIAARGKYCQLYEQQAKWLR
ncbi:MAG: ATP-binding cassette domain-containing protein, partial [Bacillota bacterium]